ncbi:hypothetical protein EV715DRAFT_249892 [Schizophyllum commune]
MRVLALASVLLFALRAYADASAGGLYPPGLAPLINRANVLLSSGQFNDAAKLYSEAIDQSPADYLLYWKRATAYYSLNRYTSALDDFDKVLSLTSNTFDNAHLMKARIFAKEGKFAEARDEVEKYQKRNKSDQGAAELLAEIALAEKHAKKARTEHKAQLWTACAEDASAALRTAGYSTEIRSLRAECALAAEDIEGAVADMTRLSHLLPPSTDLFVRIFRLSYFFLPPSPMPSNTLKQCLYQDPDSKLCGKLHKLAKQLDKAFTKLDELLEAGNWRAVIKLLTESGKNNDLMNKFDAAINEHAQREMLLPPKLEEGPSKHEQPIPLPDPMYFSPRRQTLVRSLCRAYTKTGQNKKAEPWCEQLLGMSGCSEDVDGLVGRGEALLSKEEYQEAIRVFEKAFEASGRSDRDIHQRMQKAQKLLKQSKQKDYYKILGVPRDADDRTIKKAFRQAAKSAHPDKGGSEAKMAALNEAYETLSNPELRARFDAGDDPNDPQGSQQHPFTGYGGGGHPFAQFFQQGGFPGGGHFGGPGGGSFQFHFGH